MAVDKKKHPDRYSRSPDYSQAFVRGGNGGAGGAGMTIISFNGIKIDRFGEITNA